LAYFAGPFAGLSVVLFLLLVAVLLKKVWILLFMFLLFLPVVPMNLIPSTTTEPGEEASVYRLQEEASRQLSEGDAAKQAQGEPDDMSVIEWSFDEKIPSFILEICRWICIITGSIFVIAAVKYIYEKRRGTKETLKKAGITAAAAGAFFVLAFAIARIPPRDKPIEFGTPGGVGGIGLYSMTGGQAPFFLEGEGSGKISIQKIDFPFSSIAITITLAVMVLISVLLIKYLYRKPVRLTHESENEEEKEGKETEAFSFDVTDEVLVKKAYRWIRHRKFRYLESLTPGELADRFPSENLRAITEDFVRVEYGFGKTELSEKEVRRIVNEETEIPETHTIQSEP
jgi:hypothetical protein